jgi:uncharacterized membrane protein YdjX (TVP38/TMEM64 family)
MKKLIPRIMLLIIPAFLIILVKHFHLTDYLTLDYLKENQVSFLHYYYQNQIKTIATFFVLYILVTAFSLPGAVALTLIAGALFGFKIGLIVVSFASSIGATIAFLSARLIFKNYVQKKFKKYLAAINEGIEKDGAFYLFTLRLIPFFPFFIINLVMGLTPIKTRTYFFVSQIGMLAGTAIYINAGLQISQIDSLKGILSLHLMGSFVLLGIFPLIAKKIVSMIQASRLYKSD